MELVAESVKFIHDKLLVSLNDGTVIIAPYAEFPRLANATESQRNNWRMIPFGIGIHWEEIDEDISVEGLLKQKNVLRLPKNSINLELAA